MNVHNLEPVPEADYERNKTSHPVLMTRSFQNIIETDYPPMRWVVPGYLPEGFSVLAGRQKLGKTWLALDIGVAVACGGCALGRIECEVGDVLYIDLENGERRLQQRLFCMFPDEKNRPDLSRIQTLSTAPMLDQGFLDGLEAWKLSVPNPRLVIIDVLQRIKPPARLRQNAYESDYSIFAGLQSFATESRIAILGLHHVRKGGADDPLEALSGSNGLSAVADTTLVLNRDANGMTLYVRGRDVEEKETAVRHDCGIWTILGEAADVHRSSERERILSELLTAEGSLTPADIVAATGMRRNNVDQLLYQMGKAGEVRKAKRGQYVHPERTDLMQGDTPNK